MIRQLIQRAQRRFKKNIKALVIERDRLVADSWPLLPAFVYRRLPHDIKATLGGPNEAIADLGLYYVLGVREWFTSRRRTKLSTFVWNRLLWGSFELLEERQIIKHPRPYEAAKLSRPILRARAREAKNVKLFHGMEGYCEDDAMLVPSDAYDVAIRQEWQAAVNDAKTKLRPREIRVLDLRDGIGLSLRETGSMLRVSKERVRQIHSTALKKLDDKLRQWHPGIVRDYLEHC